MIFWRGRLLRIHTIRTNKNEPAQSRQTKAFD